MRLNIDTDLSIDDIKQARGSRSWIKGHLNYEFEAPSLYLVCKPQQSYHAIQNANNVTKREKIVQRASQVSLLSCWTG